MSTKALKKQLMAAVAMMLVAIIALSGSTFAWFANNTRVSATGMSVAALSEGANLEIAWENEAATWTANAGKTAISNLADEGNGGFASSYIGTKLLPTHYVTGEETIPYADKDGIAANDWIHTFSNKYDQVGQNDYSTGDSLTKVTPYTVNGETKVVTANVVDDKQYAIVVPIYLRMNPNSGTGLQHLYAKVGITQTDANTDGKGMTTAGRVAYIVNGELKGAGYANNDVSADLGTVAAPVDGVSAVTTVYVVVYIDGDDASCKSSLYDTDNFAITVTFDETNTFTS